MRRRSTTPNPCSRHFVILLLASSLGIAAQAQAPGDVNSNLPSTSQEQPSYQQDRPSSTQVVVHKEGFWGRVNPFANKKWVKKSTDPIADRLSELDEVNARNSHEIRDVDSRSQAGILQAKNAADAANATASAAGDQARHAGLTAHAALDHVDNLKTTVNSLDKYDEKDSVDVAFRHGQPVLSSEARKSLDDLAAKVDGQPGYILEIEAHSPVRGSAGIENSERLAEAVKRYLLIEHEIPVYRMHTVSLGNVRSGDEEQDRPVRVASVHIRLMENSLAAQGTSSLQPGSTASLTGTERP